MSAKLDGGIDRNSVFMNKSTYMARTSNTTWRTGRSWWEYLCRYSSWWTACQHAECISASACRRQSLDRKFLCCARSSKSGMRRRRSEALDSRSLAQVDRRISRDQKTRDTSCRALHCPVHTGIHRCRVELADDSSRPRVVLLQLNVNHSHCDELRWIVCRNSP